MENFEWIDGFGNRFGLIHVAASLTPDPEMFEHRAARIRQFASALLFARPIASPVVASAAAAGLSRNGHRGLRLIDERPSSPLPG